GTIEQTSDNAAIFTSKEKSYFIHQFLKQLRDESVTLEETSKLMETLV
ncbi:flagellum-specific ATP synthase FliI, partial [Listeria monocytogenes]|nr:flagellum-specific ATP synthase FliI [Listeria monocytogenes]